MASDIIKRHFEIKRDIPKTLTRQLEEQTARFIETMPDNSRLPSERELAAALQVNRVTIQNALKPFFERGELITRKRLGVYTVKPRRKPKLEPLHPIYMDQFFIGRPTAHLMMMLFDGIEPLKRFWEEAVENFNKENWDIQVETEYLPFRVTNENSLIEYLEQKGVDIVPVLAASRLRRMERLLPLDRYLPPLPPDDDESPPEYRRLNSENVLAPIYFCLWHSMWNQDIETQYGLEAIEEKLLSGQLTALLGEAGKCLPETITIAGNIWNYFLLPDIPVKRDEYNRDFFRDRFESLKPLLKYPNMFYRRQKHGLEALYSLAEGNGMFYFGLGQFMLISASIADHDFRTAVLPVRPGRALPWNSCSLGINKSSSHPEEAARFIAYMQSPEVQRKMSSMTGLISPLRSVNEERRRLRSPEAAEAHRACLRRVHLLDDTIDLLLRIQSGSNHIFYDFMDGKINTVEAAGQLYDHINKTR